MIARYHLTGLTLIELLIAVAMLSIMASLAAPAWQKFAARQALVAQSNALVGLIYQARSDATEKGAVLICAGQGDCAEFGDHDNSLRVFLDSNDNRRFDQPDQLLAYWQGHAEMTIQWRSFRNRPWLRLTRNGTAWYQNGHFLLCYRGQASRVTVTRIGRPRVERDKADSSRCPPA